MAGRDRESPEESIEPQPGNPAVAGRGAAGPTAAAWATGEEPEDGTLVDVADPVGDGAGAGADAEEPDPESVEEEDPVKVALAERDEYLDSLRRLQAEFENYRKRVTSQQAEQAARVAGLLVDKLLPVLDTLDLAVQHIGDADSADGKALVASGNQLHGVLAKEGLERIDPLGEVFDPNTHEAVGHVLADEEESGDDDVDGPVPKPVVAQVMRPGYRWKGAVLRPAMVTVRG
jgi:molecular chaperone GrpE